MYLFLKKTSWGINMSFTVAMMYDFIHSLKVTAFFLQNSNQYHKDVCPCSPYKTFSTFNYWCYLSSFQQSFTWFSALVFDFRRTHWLDIRAFFHWKGKANVKRPLTCWWFCEDFDKVTSDWLQRKSPLTCIFVETKTIGFLYHCHEDLSDLNNLNIGWRATPDSGWPRKAPM